MTKPTNPSMAGLVKDLTRPKVTTPTAAPEPADAAGESGKRPESRELLLHFLNVLDTFDQVLGIEEMSSPDGTPADSPLMEMHLLRKELLEAFERSGVRFMQCAGQPFDPTLHEAVEV